jgi:hypothetical protein
MAGIAKSARAAIREREQFLQRSEQLDVRTTTAREYLPPLEARPIKLTIAAVRHGLLRRKADWLRPLPETERPPVPTGPGGPNG